jgi:hypothetical protein
MADSRWKTAAGRGLDRAVDQVAGEVSVSRLRQLRMVVGMVDRALGAEWPAGGPARPRSARGVFAEPVLRTFWDLAVAGRLRVRAQDVGLVLPVATQGVVRDCLGILAEHVVPGGEVWLPQVPKQAPKATAARGQLPVLFRTLVDMAADAPVERDGASLSERDRIRLLAMVAVVLDTGAHSAELESMRLADLGEGEGSVLVRRQPQNGAHRPYEETCVLREGTGVALRRWLRVRAALVAEALTGGDPQAVWVSLKPNQWQDTPGLPLRAQGIRMAYARGMGLLNRLMAGEFGWEPMPTTLEQLRRAVAEPDDGAAEAGGAAGAGPGKAEAGTAPDVGPGARRGRRGVLV